MTANPLGSGVRKVCYCCRIPKLLAEFGKWSISKDGHKGYCLICCKEKRDGQKTQIKERNRRYREMNQLKLSTYEKGRQSWRSKYRKLNSEALKLTDRNRIIRFHEKIDSLKAGRPCKDCDRVFIPKVMDFDHKSEYKKFDDVARMVRKHSMGRILLEISKCDLVCKNCHRIRTRLRAVRKPTESLSSSRRLQIRKTHMIDKLKSNPCTDCHECFPPECMDFDHLHDKMKSISDAVRSKGYKFIFNELKKTELTCAVCHQIRTFKRFENVEKMVA